MDICFFLMQDSFIFFTVMGAISVFSLFSDAKGRSKPLNVFDQ